MIDGQAAYRASHLGVRYDQAYRDSGLPRLPRLCLASGTRFWAMTGWLLAGKEVRVLLLGVKWQLYSFGVIMCIVLTAALDKYLHL